jgi:hypothetical protein
MNMCICRMYVYFLSFIYKFPQEFLCVYVFMDKFVSADTDQSPQNPPGSGTKQDRIYRFVYG